MSDQNRKNTKRSRNAWKRYGAIFMAGLFAAGTAAGAGLRMETVYAEEEQRITMRTADDEEQPVTRKTAEEEEERLTLKTSDKEDDERSDKKEEKDKDDEKSDKKEEDKDDEKSDKKEEKEKDDEKSDKKEEKDKDDEKSDKKEEKDKDDEKSDKKEEDKDDEKSDKKDEDEDDEKSDDSHTELKTVKTTDGEIATADFSEIVENVAPSIVLIKNKVEAEASENAAAEPYEGSFAEGLYLQEAPEAQTGEAVVSGIVIAQNDEELLIATNSYIVSETNDLKVWFAADEKEKDSDGVPAKLKGVDQGDGLAVVAVQLSDIPEDVYEEIKVAAFGSSEDMKVGQPVLAVGHEAQYGCNVTSGIVSALDREFEFGDIDTQSFVVDAPALYEGSGGAILNTKGEVLGISVAYEEGSIGYAIPVDEAIPVLERLANKETRDKMDNAERGYLGATVVNVNEDAKELYNMPEGAFVYEITEDSAADQAGIRKGDIITRFDGESVASSDDLIDKISYYAAGETVTVELQTADNGSYESREVEVTLQEGEESAAEKQIASEEEGQNEQEPETSGEEQEVQDSDEEEEQGDSTDRLEDSRRLPRGEEEQLPSIDEGFRRFPYYFFNHGGF